MGKRTIRQLALVFIASVWAAAASAEVTRLYVTNSGLMGTFGGREYLWAVGKMEGTVARPDGTTGRYRVPVVLMYPDRDPNGFGLVDVPNSAVYLLYHGEEAPGGKLSVAHVGDVLLSNLLKREGYSYISVQWSRTVTETMGRQYGLIEDGRDGYEIIRDAARFLRDPGSLEGQVAFRPPAARHVIAFGKSQTAMLLRQFVISGENRRGTGPVIDGFLAGAGGALCLALNNEPVKGPAVGQAPIPDPPRPWYSSMVPCPEPLPGDGRYISLVTESDVAAFGAAAVRDSGPNYRQYELAGVAHVAPEEFPVSFVGAERENPANYGPAFRAALRNLRLWIAEGTPPPVSHYIAGSPTESGGFAFDTDADGNVRGGLRLPHMPRPDSAPPAGAPLGVYGGLDMAFAPPVNIFAWLGGTFEPFSAAELARRYPTPEAYVQRVERAARALLEQRLILQADYEDYVADARREYAQAVAGRE